MLETSNALPPLSCIGSQGRPCVGKRTSRPGHATVSALSRFRRHSWACENLLRR